MKRISTCNEFKTGRMDFIIYSLEKNVIFQVFPLRYKAANKRATKVKSLSPGARSTPLERSMP
jgi:hypothetical protein